MMSKIYFQGFVCDEDSQHLGTSIGNHYRLFTLAEIGITVGKGTPDKIIFQHARNAGCIIITGNSLDFRYELKNAAKLCHPGRCFCGIGLITVQNGMQNFPFQKITRTMRCNGEKVDWHEVFIANLHVDVNRDRFSVQHFPICKYYFRDHAADCDDCQRLGVCNPEEPNTIKSL